MAALDITPDTVTVRFTTAETVLGLCRGVTFPRSSITGVTVVADGLAATRGIRAPGLGLPGVRKIGTWRRRGAKELVSVRRGQPAVRIELTGQPHAAVVIGVDDAERVAAELAPTGTPSGSAS